MELWISPCHSINVVSFILLTNVSTWPHFRPLFVEIARLAKVRKWHITVKLESLWNKKTWTQLTTPSHTVAACERQAGEENFRAGYQEAVGEALRYLAEGQGYNAESLCTQLSAHLQRHCEIITKGWSPSLPSNKSFVKFLHWKYFYRKKYNSGRGCPWNLY